MRLCGRKLRWNFLERRLSKLCHRYALIVADFPLPFIIIPIVTTLVSLGGWAYKQDYTDATELFTPQGAQSRSDQEAISKFFPDKDGTYLPGKLSIFKRECSVIVNAKDGGNILRYDLSKSVERLNEFVMYNINVTTKDGHNYTYQNLCMKSGSACYNNPQVYIIPLMFASADPYTNLSFPTATYDNRERYYLGATLGGVTVDPVSKHILDAKAWYLTYKLKNDPENDSSSRLFEREYERLLLSYNDPLIDVYPCHSQTLDLEVTRNSETLMPRFVLMFNMLLVFAVICTLSWRWPPSESGKFTLPLVDWTTSRPGLALLGALGAGMGVISACGFLFYGSYPYNNIVSIVPFLMVAVRLDNTFLMIAAFDNTKRLPVRERVAEAMEEAAVSITITVMTDIFSFAFGVFTDFRAVQIFSVFTTVAIIITWMYQLTFLLGCLVLYARLEEKNKHSVAPWRYTTPIDEYKSQSILTRLFCLGSHRPPETPPPAYAVSEQVIPNSESKVPIDTVARIDSTPVRNEDDHLGTPISRWFRDQYGRVLMMKKTKIGVLIVLVKFWAISIYGCCHLRQGLEPIRLLVDNSYAIPYYRLLGRDFWDYGLQVQVVIFNPGDLTNATQRAVILNAVNSFASLPHATGREGVDFWMIAFDQYLERNQDISLANLPPESFYEKLNYFLFSFKDNLRHRLDVAFRNGSGPGDNDTNPIVAIRAMIGIKGFGSLIGQQETMDSFRTLAANFSSLKVSTFHIMFLFVDQYEDIWPNVEQEIYCSMACMIVMALVLIPHPICAIWVTFAILSIDVGVIGFMTLWGLNMDTISMITIIMSIGFSVDFSAHIAYAYVVNIHEKPDDRVRKALGSLGWPVLQGGIATLLGVVFLSTTQSYMVVAFFKTVFLVIVFGLMHGLIFLPVLLNLLMPDRICGFRCVGSPKDDRPRDESQHGQTASDAVPSSLPKSVSEKNENRTFPHVCKIWFLSKIMNLKGKDDVESR